MLETYFDCDIPYYHSHRGHFDYLRSGHIANRLVFIHESGMSPWADFDRSAAFLDRCLHTSDRLPVLCLDTNPYDDSMVTWTQRLREQFGDRSFFVLAPDLRPNRHTHPCEAHWPYWLINQQFSPNRQVRREKLYRVSYLSGVARPHRLAMAHGIWPAATQEDVIVINQFGMDTAQPEWKLYPGLDPEWLASLPLATRPVYQDQQRLQWNSNCNDHPAWQARINITGETNDHRDLAFFSEKTWKAYRSGCLVINYGCDTAPAALAETGIDIWWEYDQVEDKSQKIKRVQELMTRTDLARVYDQHIRTVCRNQYLVNSLEYATSLCEPAMTKLQAWLNM